MASGADPGLQIRFPDRPSTAWLRRDPVRHHLGRVVGQPGEQVERPVEVLARTVPFGAHELGLREQRLRPRLAVHLAGLAHPVGQPGHLLDATLAVERVAVGEELQPPALQLGCPAGVRLDVYRPQRERLVDVLQRRSDHVDGERGVPGGGQMMGQKFGLALDFNSDHVGIETLTDYLGDPSLLAARAYLRPLGGTPEGNAHARADSWQQMLAFLKANL